jgi:hypothetical protein
MNRERLNKYRKLREVRRERDYQIGVLQFANRMYSKPSARLDRVKMTTRRFMQSRAIKL